VTLKSLDSPDLIQLAADWLARKENYQWLDFGDGRQQVSAEWLKIAMQRGMYVVRMFTSQADEPIGLVALSNINRVFHSATIWILTGDKSYRARGYATRAAFEMLTYGFGELGLHSINTWIVDHNPSMRIAQRLGFTLIGRQRQCHFIDGQPYDRLWFDLLASEHAKTSEQRRPGTREPEGARTSDPARYPGGDRAVRRRSEDSRGFVEPGPPIDASASEIRRPC